MLALNAQWGDDGELSTHRPYVKNEKLVRNFKELDIGDIISFMYKAKPRYVFVVHANWMDKLHALDLKLVDRQILIADIIPRLDVANDPKIFYDTVYKRHSIYELDAYRTYNHAEIQTVLQYEYDIPNSMDSDSRIRYNDT